MKKILIFILIFVSINLSGQTFSTLLRNKTIIYNVKDYGAVGDEITDNAVSIRSALTAGIGGIVYLPAGTYRIKTPLVIGPNTVVMGAGSENTIILADTSFTDKNGMFTFLVNAKDITIKNLCIDGNSAAFLSKKGEHFGIYTYNYSLGETNASNVTLENIEIKNTSGFAVSIVGGKNWNIRNAYIHVAGDTIHGGGIICGNVMGLSIENSRIDSCYEHGLYFNHGNDATIVNSFFRYNGIRQAGLGGYYGDGISMRADSNVVITGNHLTYNYQEGLCFESERNFWNNPIKNVVVTGNTISKNGAVDGNQVLVRHVSNLILSSNNIGPYINKTGSYDRGLRIVGRNKNISIIGNCFYTQVGVAVEGDTISNLSITNNDFHNEYKKVGSTAIYLTAPGPGKSVFITDNRGDSTNYAIFMSSTYKLENTTIKNNNWSTNAWGAINNESTTTNHNIEYKGSSAFTTTATRQAVFIDGMSSTYDVMVTPIAVDSHTRPVAGDFTIGFAVTDSLIFVRQAGTTSGLKFKYVANND